MPTTISNDCEPVVPGNWLLQRAHKIRAYLSLIRVYQWPKNLLIFVPLLISHEFEIEDMLDACTAFLAFSLTASSSYVFNDLRDIHSDRTHHFKWKRPLARGDISETAGILLMLALVGAGFGLSMLLPISFTVCLVVYLAGSIGYTLIFKRMLGLDIVVIACLYVMRVIAGDEAIGSNLVGLDSSDWILGFSCLLFLSLAIIKRCSELSVMSDGMPDSDIMPGRAYRIEDFHVMISLAGASALCSVAIFVRYIGSPEVSGNFQHPRVLWLIVPLMVYWLIRLILLANRGKINQDPMVYTVRDRISQLCCLAVIALTLIAW